MPVSSYREIADDLEAKIKSGEYTGKLPKVLDIVAIYSCSNRTVSKAIEALKARGLVHTQPGRGIIINEIK